MTASAWQKVSVADYRKLRDARLPAHYGTQWLARVARAYVPAQPGTPTPIWAGTTRSAACSRARCRTARGSGFAFPI